MRPQRPLDKKLQTGARARTLQYISDALVCGPSPVYIDGWLLSQSADETTNDSRILQIGSIIVVGYIVVGYELVRLLEVTDFERTRAELSRLQVNTRCRDTKFTYAEDWPDWSEATETADKALRTNASSDQAGNRQAPDARVQASEVQKRVLEYVKNTLKSNAHWTVIDAWMAEQAAEHAKVGMGQTGEPDATRWARHEAEFEIEGVWLRLEHRRNDETDREGDRARSIGLHAEIRILDPARAAELVKRIGE